MGRELERYKLKQADYQNLLRKYQRGGGSFAVDNAIEELQEVLKSEENFRFKYPTSKVLSPKSKPKVVGPNHEEIAAKCWSDWHTSEVVRPLDSNGVNCYSSMICSNRVWEDTRKTKKIIQIHRCAYPIKTLWLLALGDMINGSIHPELALTNDLFDPAATILASRLMIMGIEEYKALGLKIIVDCIVGNHPRTTLKMPTKRLAHQSFDWVVYEIVANHFAKDDQVEINVHTGQIGFREVMGHRYLFEHGIDVKSGGEEAFEDRLRGVFDDKIYRAATGMKGASFDQIVIGNMHKPKWLERTIVNGCLVGQNELGVSWRLKTIPAQQFLWGISEKHVRTWQYAVDTTHVRSEKVENPFSEYTKWFMQKHGR
jgi:hypothetical protein